MLFVPKESINKIIPLFSYQMKKLNSNNVPLRDSLSWEIQ